MSSNMNDYIVKNNQKQWQPLIENGIEYKGVSVVSLHYDEAKQRSTTIILKFEPGASYPYHNHPAGEEIFVISGEAILENTKILEGDYLYTPPQFKHSVRTEKGCTLLFVVPEEVELL